MISVRTLRTSILSPAIARRNMFSWGKSTKKEAETPVGIDFENGCIVLNTPRKLNDFSEFYRRSNKDYPYALREIKDGEKTSHWIWYIFPQLALHGYSEQAVFFGLKSYPEAVNYLLDPVLGKRLIEISTVAVEQLRKDNTRLKRLMGSSIDASKLMSSSTLFYYASQGMDCHSMFEELMSRCKEQENADNKTEEFCLAAIESLKSSAVAQDPGAVSK